MRWVLWALTLASFFGCLQIASAAQPMIEVDEPAHQSYVIALMNGTLPDIETPMVKDADRYPDIYRRLRGVDHAHQTIWVANHPPLYHLMGVPLQAFGDALESPNLGLLLLRILNAIFMSSLVLLTGLLAWELLPRRPELAMLAAAIMAAFQVVTFLGGFVYNDGLLAASTTALMLLTVRCLRWGVTTMRLVGIAALGSAAALTRVTSLPLVALSAIGLLVAVLLYDRRPGRWRRACGAAVVVGGSPTVVAGWFYVRNMVLYGDPTGSAALLARFGRRPRGDSYDYLEIVGTEWERLFAYRLLPNLKEWRNAYGLVGLVLLVGLAIVIAFWARREFDRRRTLGVEWRRPSAIALTTGWLIALTYFVSLQAGYLSFISGGGSPHERYLIAVAPTFAVLAALGASGFAELAGRRFRQRVELLIVFVAATGAFGSWIVTQSHVMASIGRRPREPVGGHVLPVVSGWMAIALGCCASALMLTLSIRAFRQADSADTHRVVTRAQDYRH